MFWNTYSTYAKQEKKDDQQKQQQQQQNMNFKRPKKLALLNEKQVVSEPILEFLKKDQQYEWKISFDRTQIIIADLVFGYKRRESQFCQAFSYIQNIDQYDNKRIWKDLLKRFDKNNNFQLKSYNMHPESYTINYSSKDFTQDEIKFLEIRDENQFYIEKDPVGLDGKGIKMIGNLQEYQNFIKTEKQKQGNDIVNIKRVKQKKQEYKVIQKYISNPLLLGGKKFDFRCYVLMFCLGTNFIYFFQHGYIRSCIVAYDTNDINIEKHTTHTGHVKKLKKELNEHEYQDKLGQAQLTMEDFESQFMQEYGQDKQFLKIIYKNIKKSLTYGFLAGQSYLERKPGTFHLFGCDVLLDTEYNAYFLEPNVYPNLQLFTKAKQISLEPVARDTVNIAMAFQSKLNQMENLAKTPKQLPLGKFEIIYNQATGYNILNK